MVLTQCASNIRRTSRPSFFLFRRASFFTFSLLLLAWTVPTNVSAFSLTNPQQASFPTLPSGLVPRVKMTSTSLQESLASTSSDISTTPHELIKEQLQEWNIPFQVLPTFATCGEENVENHVKTLIWEATLQIDEDEDRDDGTNSRTIHFATACRLEDRIDTKALSSWLISTIMTTPKEKDKARVRPSVVVKQLQLAPAPVERFTNGIPSGTIPPFGYKLPIIMDTNIATMTSTAESALRVGSAGLSGMDLQLTRGWNDLLRIANNTMASVDLLDIATAEESIKHEETTSESPLNAFEENARVTSVDALFEQRSSASNANKTKDLKVIPTFRRRRRSLSSVSSVASRPTWKTKQRAAYERLVHKLRSHGILFKSVERESSSIRLSNDDKDGSVCTDYVQLKTLFWKVTFRHYDEQKKGGGNESSLYFITCLRDEDSIDTEFLKNQLVSQAAQRRSNSDVTIDLVQSVDKLSQLTGYYPTMERANDENAITTEGQKDEVMLSLPPFAHIIPMTIMLDDGVLEDRTRPIRVGSGSPGVDLQMHLVEFMRICSLSTKVLIRPITKGRAPPRQINKVLLENQLASRMNDVHNGSDTGAVVEEENPFLTKIQQDRAMENDNGGDNYNAVKPLAKRLRDAAGKEGRVDDLRQCIEEAGDAFPELLYGGKDGNFTKNALHNAAWKGDLESCTLLVEAGIRHGLPNLINEVSVGSGNYGKTPIFYAITRDRPEHVRRLIELGASLLIVNNKGQTPCSLAPSRFSPEFREYMYQVEEEQIRRQGGGLDTAFVNYRGSHSDNLMYGDLDPRFPIDEINQGDDILQELERYHSDLKHARSINGIPVGSNFPRVLRRTTQDIRYQLACDRWGRKPKPKKPERKQSGSKSQSSSDMMDASGSVAGAKQATMEIDKLDTLTLRDIGDYCTVLVDSMDTLKELQEEVSSSLEQAIQSSMSTLPEDDTLLDVCWGVDCEWQPRRGTGIDHPVATLQLASASKVFLVDLQELCQPSQRLVSLPLTPLEVLLSDILTDLFLSEKIAKVGFGVTQDLTKLSFSFPHLSCFNAFHSVIDFPSLHNLLFPGVKQKNMSSLQKAAAVMLGKKLDKTEQCSDWKDRPLRPQQLDYATLDAVATREILVQSVKKQAGTSNDFFHRHPTTRQSIRMTFLGAISEVVDDINQLPQYQIERGSEKRLLGVRMAKQSWSAHDQEPSVPIMLEPSKVEREPATQATDAVNRIKTELEIEDDTNADAGDESGLEADPAKIHATRDKSANKQKKQGKRKAALLRNLPAGLEGLPPIGSSIGYKKDDCVDAMLGDTILNSIAHDTFSFRYSRWGGVIQMANAWLLFINCDGQQQQSNNSNRRRRANTPSQYRNEFGDNGRYLSFSLAPYKDREARLLQDIGVLNEFGQMVDVVIRPDTDDKEQHQKELLVFARISNREQYMYLGPCECRQVIEMEDGRVELILYPTEYEALLQNNNYATTATTPELSELEGNNDLVIHQDGTVMSSSTLDKRAAYLELICNATTIMT